LRPDRASRRFPFCDRHIILASSSPRRHYLLNLVRMKHRVVRPAVREEDHAHGHPVKHVLRLSRLKALSVVPKARSGIVLGADTIVVHNGAILEKPQDRADARRMLRRLSGHWHRVYTGLALVDAATGEKVEGYERSLVKIRPMTDVEIDAYIATGEPLDKAGSYGIQGYGAAIVEKVNGCYFNVVGLPLVRLLYLLRELEEKIGGRRSVRARAD
jgi:septum formation protein